MTWVNSVLCVVLIAFAELAIGAEKPILVADHKVLDTDAIVSATDGARLKSAQVVSKPL
jgi:hypothetical protein